jgi:CheY-like chemotaxis protein
VVEYASSLPPVTIAENKLGQVLINLLLNAAQAIAPGNVSNHRVTISARVATTPGQRVVEVRDTGCGMSPEIAGSIFERFFTTKPSGTGLGLAVCREIVASVGGAISVESELGAGTVFRFTLPIAGTVDAVPPAEKRITGPFRRGRILVIDDEELVALAIKRILDDQVVVTATSGKAALELIARDEDFDVIFSDLGMPNMTGVELFEALRTLSPQLARRVVFLTGGATTAVAAQFLTSLSNMRLHKPRDLDRLPNIVQELLAEQHER